MKVHLQGEAFVVNESLHPSFWAAAHATQWEHETFDIIDKFVGEGDFVADIGCWMGPLTLYMAKKGATVFALDPDPTAYKALLENIKLNPSLEGSIKPHNIAISDKTDTYKLYARSEYGNSSTSLLNRAQDNVSAHTSKGMSLSDFLQWQQLSHIKFLKVDIEGGEFAILNHLKALKRDGKFDSLVLSLHYGYLIEYIYQKNISFRLLNKLLVRIEKYTGIIFYKNKILSHLEGVISLCKEFNFAFSLKGQKLETDTLTPQLLLNHRFDLFLSNELWDFKGQ